jgi:2-polyprenyl-3-methyl-5-hydroxy-6-metoxy-1,4-benzoquinol methylase
MATPELRVRRREAYETERPEVQALVPASARSVLDLGCASGMLGAQLKRRQAARVVGVELDPGYAASAAERLDRVVQGSVEEALRECPELGRFDCIVAADILEHLVDPWATLRDATALLEPGGTVVVSIPNVRTLELLIEVGLRGRWPRADHGLFDHTHLRWFALSDARELLEQAGLSVERVERTFFYMGWRLWVVRRLAHTPLAPWLTGQYLMLARKPA